MPNLKPVTTSLKVREKVREEETRMALWGGRFSSGPNQALSALSRSVHFDWRLAPYDLRVNLAHLNSLIDNGFVSAGNGEVIRAGLKALFVEIEEGRFSFKEDDEDVHSAIERGLIEKIGAIGSSIRAGRSRNDLVVTDFKLYLVDHILEVAAKLALLVGALNVKSKEEIQTMAPGFTHLQHAQPILFSHELAKHSQALLRDIDRIADWLERNNYSPFGAGALSGTSLQPNPEMTAEQLGFYGVLENSLDAVSDRDFAVEALFIFALVGVHLSRIGEEFTLWNSTEFGWVKLSDEYSTGSSIMPQKKNPDIAELARGKSGRLIGNLVSLLTTLKGLPFAYNRDLQEDKEPSFDSIETLLLIIPALTGMIETATFNQLEIERGATSGHSLATEIADYLAKKGVPFAQAHEAAGTCVKIAERKGVELSDLSDEDFASANPQLQSDIRSLLSARGAIETRTSALGTSLASVSDQLDAIDREIAIAKNWISNAKNQFSGMMSL
jgi:argininosuccinate lyase